jgi:hypothetical protein
VYSAGQPIGRLVWMDPPNASGLTGGNMWIASSKGYLCYIERATGRMLETVVWFANGDCTCAVYYPYEVSNWAAIQGAVLGISPSAPVNVLYSPRGTQPAVRTYASEYHDSQCSNVSGSKNFVVVLPNDPEVTGVADEPFATPILVGTP